MKLRKQANQTRMWREHRASSPVHSTVGTPHRHSRPVNGCAVHAVRERAAHIRRNDEEEAVERTYIDTPAATCIPDPGRGRQEIQRLCFLPYRIRPQDHAPQ